jgi:hypothetical protein
MKSKLFIVFAILTIFICGIDADAQDKRVVSGIVTTAHQFPLNNVKVTASKSGEVAYTDSVGRFSLNSFNKDVLTASAAGFDSKKIRVGKLNTYLIDLLYNDNVVNFNDAVSHGHIAKEALQKAISSVQLKNQKDYSKYNSIYELISCEIYQVRVDPPNVFNKAVRSLNSNPQVLYVIDGKMVDKIENINPTYVKTIEFIDDASAAIYGVKGANGVIKITLK